MLGSCCFSMMVRSVPQGRNFPHFMDVPRCMFSLCPDTRHGWRELSSRAGCGHSATPRPAARCAGSGGRSGPGTGCREYISQPWPCTPTAAPEHVAVLLPDSDDGGLGIIEHEEQHDQHEDDLQYSTVQYSTVQYDQHEDDLVPQHSVLDGGHVPQQQLLHWSGQRGVLEDRVNLLPPGTIPKLPGVAITIHW